MSRRVKIDVKLNDGSGRTFSQVVPMPGELPAVIDSYTQERADEWVAHHAQSMVLVDWEFVR